MYRKMSLAQKLVVLFLAFGLLPAFIIGLIAYKATDSVVTQRFEDVAVNIADKIDRNLFERYGDVQAFALNRVILNRDQWHKIGDGKNGIVAVMNQYVDTYDIYSLTILVDLEGNVIAVNSKDADGKPIQTEAIYTKNYRSAPWFHRPSRRLCSFEGCAGFSGHELVGAGAHSAV